MKDPTNIVDAQELRVHRFLPRTEAEGPGRRSALWVQGCSIGCKGCFNAQTWVTNAGHVTTVDDLHETIQQIQDIEGVTFVGGEPFQQPGPLAQLGERCVADGLSIVTFTGYPHAVLRNRNREDWNRLLAVTDLLLAGPYIASMQDFSRPWVGSSNQEIIFLTDRYRYLESQLAGLSNRIEAAVGTRGEIALNGQAPSAVIEGVLAGLEEFGMKVTQLN